MDRGTLPKNPEDPGSAVVLLSEPLIVTDSTGARFKITEFTPGAGFAIVRPVDGGPAQILEAKGLRPATP
ncbi:hypothetical protein GCM10009839_90660 [Catenulispora yoronensis]|uniref:Uncharacterized protein n=1 Tax=Catenulispora yoronensis TaxID=450799 RepID=A0ABN2VKN4_9ACTN